jgi:hypothetical protein
LKYFFLWGLTAGIIEILSGKAGQQKDIKTFPEIDMAKIVFLLIAKTKVLQMF